MNRQYSKLQSALRQAGYSCINNAVLEPNMLELWTNGSKTLLVEIDHPSSVQIYKPLIGERSFEETVKEIFG